MPLVVSKVMQLQRKACSAMSMMWPTRLHQNEASAFVSSSYDSWWEMLWRDHVRRNVVKGEFLPNTSTLMWSLLLRKSWCVADGRMVDLGGCYVLGGGDAFALAGL
jgi:hypothetical protein